MPEYHPFDLWTASPHEIMTELSPKTEASSEIPAPTIEHCNDLRAGLSLHSPFEPAYSRPQSTCIPNFNRPVHQLDTLEPRMTLIHQQGLPIFENTPPYSPNSNAYTSHYRAHSEMLSSLFGSTSPQNSSIFDDPGFAYTDDDVPLPNSITPSDHEYDDPVDKPYARLIYEALLQAPGHRMMLRDIYNWFTKNTTKPRDSGTNGWQNSIRHNLSMNQAFENEKPDMSGRRHTRKANSVWRLTDHAIQHGVQSTTRYRKSGFSKRYSNHDATAMQRRKSGSKGGRAARRAAVWRRQEENSRKFFLEDLNPLQSSELCADPKTSFLDHNLPDYDLPNAYRPTTPADTSSYGNVYSLPQSQLLGESQTTKLSGFELDEDDLLQGYQDADLNDLSKLGGDSPSIGHTIV